MRIDINQQNKQASDWLLNIEDKRRSYIQAVSAFTDLAATQYSGMPHGTEISNPTMKKGINLADIEQAKEWIMVIELTEKCLSEKRKVFLEIRRHAERMEGTGDRGRNGWVVYVQARYADWHCRKFGMYFEPSKRVMFNWWHDIRDLTVRIGIKKGCL